jgi:O-methyltransferase
MRAKQRKARKTQSSLSKREKMRRARWVAFVNGSGNIPMFRLREDLHAFVNNDLCHNSQVDYFEFEVYNGYSLRLWTQMNTHPESRFLDSFEGLPEEWIRTAPKASYSASRNVPDTPDPRAHCVEGWFQQSLPGFLATYEPRECTLVIHGDSDLYISTLYFLTSLNGLIRLGTIIVFDEFDSVLDEYRALTEYTRSYMRNYRVVCATTDFVRVAVQII